MGLKKKSKISAEFNMSSLTDIIFLLLIFFMLTSTVVAPNALNLKLPSSSTSHSSPPKTLDVINIRNTGSYTLNGGGASLNAIEKHLKSIKQKHGSDAAIRIAPSDSAPTYAVVKVLDLARINKVATVLDAIN